MQQRSGRYYKAQWQLGERVARSFMESVTIPCTQCNTTRGIKARAECEFIVKGLGKHSKDGTIGLEYYVRSRFIVLRGSRALVEAAWRPLRKITMGYMQEANGKREIRLPRGCQMQRMWRMPPQSDYMDNDRPIPFYIPLH